MADTTPSTRLREAAPIKKKVYEGVMTFLKSDPSEEKDCICCPNEKSHVFCTFVKIPGVQSIGSDIDDFITQGETHHKNNEGAKVRITVEVFRAALTALAEKEGEK